MSRHRNVRNMNYDDYDDGQDDYYSDEDYADDDEDESYLYSRDAADKATADIKLPGEEKALIASGVEYIRSVLGDAVTLQECEVALKKWDLDAERALQFLLDRAEEKKQHAQAMARAIPAVVRPQNNSAPKTADKPKEDTTTGTPFTPAKDDEVFQKQADLVEKKKAGHNQAKANEKARKTPAATNGKKTNVPADAADVSQLDTDMDGLGLAANIPQPKPVKVKAAKGRKKIDIAAAYEERQKNEKTKICLVVVGHVDAGKSTLMGHLLYKVGKVDKRTMHKYEKDSEKIGKSSFAFAWVLDETGEERERGITVDVAKTYFETEHRDVALLDAPGHKDFIPNMITGAAQADVAILVVDATTNEFESGFETGGQTREHALLIRSLGVSQLLVAVNKLENADWAQTRFDEIKGKLAPFLKQVGFKEKNITYVPCSGLKGVNLLENTEQKLLKWYKGETLLAYIDTLDPPERSINHSLRMSVSDVFKGAIGGASVLCTIHTGKLQVGDPVMHMPGGTVGTVKKLEVQEYVQDWAVAGDVVTISLDSGIDIDHVAVGHFFCDPSDPVKCTDEITAQIVLFDVDVPITRGYPIVLHYQSVNESGYITKLVNQLNKTTGELVKKNPRVLTKYSTGTVKIKLSRSVCLEEYKSMRELGRFMLRDKGKTIAAAIVTDIA